jgi:hypothetical protein
MKNVIGLSAGLVLATGVYQEVEAATFTPDMWVYEIEFTPTSALVGLTPSVPSQTHATDFP